MTALVIAQFTRPPEGLSYDYFFPLVLIGLVYALLLLVARVLGSRGDEDAADSVQLAGFVVMLAAGLYVIGLAVYALSLRAGLVGDMVSILLIVFAFFALLILVMLGAEQAIGSLGRSRTRRRRSDTGAPPS